MTTLILYASTEGQTRKIARRAASHLTLRGQSVELVPVAEAEDIDYARFDSALLMASIHAGRYQPEFIKSVTRDKDVLAGLKTAFLSVSLSAASNDAEDKEGMEECLRRMIELTGWTPQEVLHVGGAFRFAEYDFLKSWAMRWIAARKDPEADTDGTTEYTDWIALYEFLDHWIATPALSVRSA